MSGSSSPLSASPTTGADAFLDADVTDDGRVLRHDRGDDVVGEGQAYGMLTAELPGWDDPVRAIWFWTPEQVRTPTGPLS